MKRGILYLVLVVLLVSSIGVSYIGFVSAEELSCNSDNLNLCSDEASCTAVGGFWRDDVCNKKDSRGEKRDQIIAKVRGNKTTTFVPWQKRNESECLEGCKCVGAVVSCPTETGKIITIEAGRSGKVIIIIINKTKVDTELELEAEDGKDETGKNRTKLKVRLSNGRKADVKIMPDTASEKALERLRLKVCSEKNNCTIVLKETGKSKKDRKVAYEVQAQRHFKILAFFKARALVKAEVDAETGEIIITKKPWWAFLATELDE